MDFPDADFTVIDSGLAVKGRIGQGQELTLTATKSGNELIADGLFDSSDFTDFS